MASPDSLTSLSRTAAIVAVARAGESERPDRLFDDPYAAAFVAATAVGRPVEGEDDVTSAAAAAALGFQVALRTRFFDDFLLEACGRRLRQVVLLAAGFDARAFRLPWPANVRLFELDLPEVLRCKHEVLAAQAAVARCERHALGIDLRGDWPSALLAAGFRRGEPTAWLVEGLLIYLTADQATELLRALGDLSAPGSCLGCERANFADAALLEQAQTLLGPEHFSSLWQGGLGYDAADWLPAHGWQVRMHDIGVVAAAYGRPAHEQLGGGFLTAVRPGRP